MKKFSTLNSNFLFIIFCVLAFAEFWNPLLAQVDDTRLPTGRAITPAGQTLSFYGRPVDLAMNRDGTVLFVKDRNHLRAIDSRTFKEIHSSQTAGGASLYGLAVDGAGRIYYSNSKDQVHVFEFGNRKLKLLHSIQLEKDSFPCGICLSGDEMQLYVCLSKKNALAIIDLNTRKTVKKIEVGVAPFDVVHRNDKLLVSNLGGRRAVAGDKTASSAGTETVVDKRGIANTGTVSILSLSSFNVIKEVVTGLHPSAMTVGQHFAWVCNSNQDSLSRIELASSIGTTHSVKPDDRLPFGSMPSAVTWLPDKKHLLVALAGNNAILVLQRQDDNKIKELGLIPTAWFPGALACNQSHLFVANIKGYGSRSIRRDIKKGRNSHDHQAVIQKISIEDIIDPDKLKIWTRQVKKNTKLAQIVRNRFIAENIDGVDPKPIPDQLGQASLFKHVVYVIKENRTFDQVFGDYENARSDPALCIFPRKITPNHHALADRFGILDNYYCNGVLSADGHSWATEGNVTPYLERAFGGFSRSYTFGDDPITYSSSGFIWDHILAAGLSFRNYGEMDYAKPRQNLKYQQIYKKYIEGDKIEFTQNIGIDRLRKYSCRDYPGWNMQIPDVLRIDRFLGEFRKFEREGGFPNFSIVYLPQDHLGAGGVTSQAHMADNDLALGRLVESISKSKYWKDTVIFVNEDDPQNGYDHIDGHRSICLVISPYSKRGVNHNFYNQTSVIRTMLHIFGIPPMNQQDGSAPLMRECFTDRADLSPYEAITPEIPLNQKPKQQSNWSPEERRWRRILKTVPIERTGMKTEKDEDNLNRFVWHEVKGWTTPYPRVYAGPHGKGLKLLGLKLDANREED